MTQADGRTTSERTASERAPGKGGTRRWTTAVGLVLAAALGLLVGPGRLQASEPASVPDPRPPGESAAAGAAAAADAEPAPSAAPEPVQPGPMELYHAFTRTRLAAAGFARHEAEVGGQPLVWWEKGEGPSLVMLHGVADQAGTWFLVAPALADEHRVLLVDLPGHGESGPAAGPLPMTAVVDGFEGWLAHHAGLAGDPPPVLVGNSMGAWVALIAAHRHPERVGRVVAVNGGPLRPDPPDGLDLLPGDREEARRLMAALRDPGSPPIPDPVLDDLVRRAETGQVRRMFAAEADLDGWLLEGRLGEVATPVDVLWGASDRYMGADFPRRLAAGLPRARLTPIDGCGHLPQAECPELFLAALREVLALPPPAGGAAEPAATRTGDG